MLPYPLQEGLPKKNGWVGLEVFWEGARTAVCRTEEYISRPWIISSTVLPNDCRELGSTPYFMIANPGCLSRLSFLQPEDILFLTVPFRLLSLCSSFTGELSNFPFGFSRRVFLRGISFSDSGGSAKSFWVTGTVSVERAVGIVEVNWYCDCFWAFGEVGGRS